MGATRVQLCGRLALTWDGQRMEDRLPSRQGRLLFAHLVVHRARPVTRDALVEAVWGETPPDAAPGALRALLSRLRRVLGADAVTAGEEPRIVLPADAFVDLEAAHEGLHRAEAAVAAGDAARAWAPARIALHTADRGFLPGCDLPWAVAERLRLEDVHIRALEAVGAAALLMGGGELPSAERAGRRLTQLAPFRENGHRLLMEALARQGNTAEALLAYERLRVLLRDELGTAPCAPVQELHARLLAG